MGGRGAGEGIYRAARQVSGSGSSLEVARRLADQLRAALDAATPPAAQAPEASPEEAAAQPAQPITDIIALVPSRRSGSE